MAAWLEGQEVSERRTCEALGVSRSLVRYEGRGPDVLNVRIGEEMKALAARHRRYGTPRMTVLLRRGGYEVNHKRVERVYGEMGLQVPRKRPRRRCWGVSTVDRPVPAGGPDEVWSIDFVHDKTWFGEKLKMLPVVDEWSRECVDILVGKRLGGWDVVEVLEALAQEGRVPKYIRSDNGQEFRSKALGAWLRAHGVGIVYIAPGSPWENGYVESFNGKFRAECLDEEIFLSRAEAQVIVEKWRQEYNEERPHSALGYRTPSEVAGRPSPHGGRKQENASNN